MGLELVPLRVMGASLFKDGQCKCLDKQVLISSYPRLQGIKQEERCKWPRGHLEFMIRRIDANLAKFKLCVEFDSALER